MPSHIEHICIMLRETFKRYISRIIDLTICNKDVYAPDKHRSTEVPFFLSNTAMHDAYQLTIVYYMQFMSFVLVFFL